MSSRIPSVSAAAASQSKKHTGIAYLDSLKQELEAEEYLLESEDTYKGMTVQQLRDYAEIQDYNVEEIADDRLVKFIRLLDLDKWRDTGFPEAPVVPTTTGRVSDLFDQTTTTSLHIWLQFFPAELRELILKQSNQYAAMKGGWKNGGELTMGELIAFFSMILWLADFGPSKMSDFWAVDPFRSTGLIEKPIGRERFKEILANLHLAQEVRRKPHEDRAAKIRPMLDILNRTFSDLWVPASRVTVDEDVCLFKGRYSMRRTVPGKPNPTGFKIFRLCDAEHFLYRINNISIFQRKDVDAVIGPMGMGRGEAVVLDLLQGLLDNQQPRRHLFCDSTFTSVHLARFLKKKGIYLTGTIRINRRGLPKEWLKDVEVETSSASLVDDHGVTLHVWKDIKQVVVLSAAFLTGSQQILRWIDGSYRPVECPEAIVNFQHGFSSYADSHNQSRSQLELHQKSYKWWHHLFYYLLECTVVNSWIVFKQLHPTMSISCRQFAVELYKQLIVLSKGPEITTQRLERHTLERTKLKGACKKCEGRTTTFRCMECGVNLHEKCFHVYHYQYAPAIRISELK